MGQTQADSLLTPLMFRFHLCVKLCHRCFDLCRQGGAGSQSGGGRGGSGLRLDLQEPVLDRPALQEHLCHETGRQVQESHRTQPEQPQVHRSASCRRVNEGGVGVGVGLGVGVDPVSSQDSTRGPWSGDSHNAERALVRLRKPRFHPKSLLGP